MRGIWRNTKSDLGPQGYSQAGMRGSKYTDEYSISNKRDATTQLQYVKLAKDWKDDTGLRLMPCM